MENIYPFTDNQRLNQEAAAWLIMLDGDKPLNRKSMAELHEWMSRSAQHREKLTGLAATWNKLNVLSELAVPLDKPAKPRRASVWLPRPQSRFALASVTGVFVLCMIVLLAARLLPDSLDQTNGRYATAIGRQQQLTLADGSTLQLNTNTVVNVTYGEHFRDIHLLQGEAYFEVAKNKRKPFRVFAGKGRVQAVGTAFAVHLREDKVAVTVTEGRVVLAGVDDEPVNQPGDTVLDQPPKFAENLGTLVAGQGAAIKNTLAEGSDASSRVVLDELQVFQTDDIDRQLSWRRGLLVFSGEPLEQVVKEISRYTTMDIEIPEEEVRSIKVGGQFEVGDTEMMLDAFEDTFALKVVRTGNNRVLVLAGKE
jgi:transmembrane sensor